MDSITLISDIRGWLASTPALYVGDAAFKSWPENWLLWLTMSVDFLGCSRYYLKLGHNFFLPHYFQSSSHFYFHFYPTFLCCVVTSTDMYKYRVIHKSLRDFRPLRYSSRDGHAEGEHVNRGRDNPTFCPTLQVLDMLTSEGSWQTFLAHARQSRPKAPAGLFLSQRTGSHSAGISCTTHELFCP